MTSTELPATPERLMVEPKPKCLTAVTYNDDASDLHEILFLALHGHNIIYLYYTLLLPELAVFERFLACARAAPVRHDVAVLLHIYVQAGPILQSKHFLAPCVFFVAPFHPLHRLNWPQRSRLLIRTSENM
jgi:hypothetical protein